MLQEIEHKLERMAIPIVRIRHVESIGMGGKFEESNRPSRPCDGSHLEQPRVVVRIHGEQQIESIEILTAHFASPQRCQVIPSPSRRIDRAWIGSITDVIRVRAGRVHLEHELRKLSPRNVAKYDLCRR